MSSQRVASGLVAPSMRDRLRAYVELSRVSNLPTVVTNVLVGVAIGTMGAGQIAVPWASVAATTLALCLLYVGGIALNDVVDAPIDAIQRAERPIPSGRIDRRSALAYAALCLVAGWLLVAVQGREAATLGLVLVGAIAAYDITHKRHASSALLMGLCRGLVYMIAATTIAWPLDWSVAVPLAAALGTYITGLTLIAQMEASPETDARRWVSLVLPLVVCAPLLWVRPSPSLLLAVTVAAAVGWLIASARHLWAGPAGTKAAVLGWLAGICLVDAMYLAALGRGGLVVAAVACFALTQVSYRHVSGT